MGESAERRNAGGGAGGSADGGRDRRGVEEIPDHDAVADGGVVPADGGVRAGGSGGIEAAAGGRRSAGGGSGEVEERAKSVAIGRAIGNSTAYVLDGNGKAQPVGVAGELYVGGAGLARGYVGEPAWTAERFVPDPFGEAGGRLYRTGDRARWRRDGQLEYLGRLDDQVKIRGHRIEPGEIEAALLEHEEVRQAAVVARWTAGGEAQLVAYVAGEAGAEELRSYLNRRLPAYLIPARFQILEQLPLTVNGKVDRKGLPEPEGERPGLETGYEAPRDETERALAEIWQEVLGIERVGIHDNFFDLGGHSLLATQVMSRIAQRLQAQMPLRTLFERPTVAELAVAVPRSKGTVAAIPVVARS